MTEETAQGPDKEGSGEENKQHNNWKYCDLIEDDEKVTQLSSSHD